LAHEVEQQEHNKWLVFDEFSSQNIHNIEEYIRTSLKLFCMQRDNGLKRYLALSAGH